MRPINWKEFHKPDGTLDLVAALTAAREGKPPLAFPEEADAYLHQVEAIAHINSRQIGALALLEAERRGQVGAQ